MLVAFPVVFVVLIATGVYLLLSGRIPNRYARVRFAGVILVVSIGASIWLHVALSGSALSPRAACHRRVRHAHLPIHLRPPGWGGPGPCRCARRHLRLRHLVLCRLLAHGLVRPRGARGLDEVPLSHYDRGGAGGSK